MDRKLTEILYNDVKDAWQAFMHHPFITEMADGTLPIEKFRYYMIQDYRYLFDYGKVFALGVVKADDLDVMQFFSQQVHNTFNGEMNIHRAYMKRLGITKEELMSTPRTLSSLSYTHYMLTIGYREDVLSLLVSILACAWSYQEIGQHLAKIPGTLENASYGEWVQGYISEDYTRETSEILAMVDRLGKDADGGRLEHLREIFRICTAYEGMFWDMAYRMGD